MPKLHVMGPNLRGTSETFHVHGEGCADVRRSPLYAGTDHKHDRENASEYGSLQDVVTYVYPPDDFGYAPGDWHDLAHDFKIFPCVKDLPGA